MSDNRITDAELEKLSVQIKGSRFIKVELIVKLSTGLNFMVTEVEHQLISMVKNNSSKSDKDKHWEVCVEQDQRVAVKILYKALLGYRNDLKELNSLYVYNPSNSEINNLICSVDYEDSVEYSVNMLNATPELCEYKLGIMGVNTELVKKYRDEHPVIGQPTTR